MDGKGYLLNEPGAQPTSVYGEFSCNEEPEVDSPGGKMTLDPYSFSKMGETMEVGGGGDLGAGRDSSRGKSILLKFIGVRTAGRLAVAPRPPGLPEMRLLRGGQQGLLCLCLPGLRVGGVGDTAASSPPSSHSLLYISQGILA